MVKMRTVFFFTLNELPVITLYKMTISKEITVSKAQITQDIIDFYTEKKLYESHYKKETVIKFLPLILRI